MLKEASDQAHSFLVVYRLCNDDVSLQVSQVSASSIVSFLIICVFDSHRHSTTCIRSRYGSIITQEDVNRVWSSVEKAIVVMSEQDEQ